MDAKDAEYVLCPRCGGLGPKDCRVCHGMKTVRKALIDWGASRGLRLAYVRSPAERAEDLANAEIRRAEAQKRADEWNAKHPPKPLERFSIGDWVTWSSYLVPEVEPVRGEDHFEYFLQHTLWQMRDEYGNGPFRVTRIEIADDRFSPKENDQLLFLERSDGSRFKNSHPRRERIDSYSLGFQPVDSTGKPIPEEARRRTERLIDEGAITAAWFTKVVLL